MEKLKLTIHDLYWDMRQSLVNVYVEYIKENTNIDATKWNQFTNNVDKTLAKFYDDIVAELDNEALDGEEIYNQYTIELDLEERGDNNETNSK